MARVSNKKKNFETDRDALSAPDFRWFLKYFPEGVLQRQGVTRSAMWGVGMALAQYGNYEQGTGIRVSHLAISKDAGVSRNTVRKVLDLFKLVGAVQVVDQQRRGGSSSENYRFRRSRFVRDVLDVKSPEMGKTKRPARSVQTEHSMLGVEQSVVHAGQEVLHADHDKNSQNEKNSKNHSEAIAPSRAPVPPSLTAGDGAEEEKVKNYDERINYAFMAPDLRQLLEGI
jgi:hypothetical protein